MREIFIGTMNAMPNLVKALHLFIEELHAQEVHTFLASFIANSVGPIHQEDWDELKELSKKPCGEKGCTCEISREKLFIGLDAIRSMWKDKFNDPQFASFFKETEQVKKRSRN